MWHMLEPRSDTGVSCRDQLQIAIRFSNDCCPRTRSTALAYACADDLPDLRLQNVLSAAATCNNNQQQQQRHSTETCSNIEQ